MRHLLFCCVGTEGTPFKWHFTNRFFQSRDSDDMQNVDSEPALKSGYGREENPKEINNGQLDT